MVWWSGLVCILYPTPGTGPFRSAPFREIVRPEPDEDGGHYCAYCRQLPCTVIVILQDLPPYVTGIGNAHSIYWQSVFRLRVRIYSHSYSTATYCSHPDAFVMFAGTSAVLCNVLTPSREVWRAKSTPFLLSASTCAYAGFQSRLRSLYNLCSHQTAFCTIKCGQVVTTLS